MIADQIKNLDCHTEILDEAMEQGDAYKDVTNDLTEFEFRDGSVLIVKNGQLPTTAVSTRYPEQRKRQRDSANYYKQLAEQCKAASEVDYNSTDMQSVEICKAGYGGGDTEFMRVTALDEVISIATDEWTLDEDGIKKLEAIRNKMLNDPNFP